MSHFAKVEAGHVTQRIVAEIDFINTGLVGNPAQWKQTSFNTRGNVHYGTDGTPDGAPALRGNFAGIGDIYDAKHDVFYKQQPFSSWTLDRDTWLWASPVPCPEDGKPYRWDEDIKNWII